jgi:hypothetical protein
VLLILCWVRRNDELYGGGILDTLQLMYHKSDGLQNYIFNYINPLNAKLNPICHLLALLGVHLILHVGKIRVKACDIVKQSQTLRYKGKAILNNTLKYKFQTTVSFTIC